MSTVANLINELRKNGHRITKVRQAVLDIFSSQKAPISAQELIDQLKSKSIAVNKTTVYRETDFLLKEKLLREVDLLDGKKRYELLHDDDHHHHMICTECRRIQCVEMSNDLDLLEREIMKRFGFKVTNHTLEFFGICKGCQ